MPRRDDIHTILIIGSGPIKIGQACEFDYSGAQACKALKEEGYRIVLLNSNPATIMTDPLMADATYIEPIEPMVVESIIKKERVDAILPTVGGQTALNCALKISESGLLDEHSVELIGANINAIKKAESRLLFNDAMASAGLEVPKSVIVRSLSEALESLPSIGLPAIIRPSFTLGGTGGGIAYTKTDYEVIVRAALRASPVTEVLIDESLLGWCEYEMEVVRDKNDNAIVICAIENIDPMGVHTGDSITVAPALTLSDKQYQTMRDASLKVIREIGVETGGSNVQFALHPTNGRMLVIEMNPRVSRSSALASKATGFPIAKVAAKLAVGYTLDEVTNEITGLTPASFEPVMDYVITKIPRFSFDKFAIDSPQLTTSMQSVGEVMAIGRSFAESLQKALCSLENGLTGLNTPQLPALDSSSDSESREYILSCLELASPDKLLQVAEALRRGCSIADVVKASSFSPWYVNQLAQLVEMEASLIQRGLPTDPFELHYLKKQGFSDARISELVGCEESTVRSIRNELSVSPVYKTIDTCAGEFPASTPYLYSTYESYPVLMQSCESAPSDRKKIIILGGGPNRIGQGIEFDYACVHAILAFNDKGYETVIINCNPETVSTDFDCAEKLFFEPVTTEHVMEIVSKENQNGNLLGVVVSFGGQTPLKLSQFLLEENITVLGTHPDMIDLAEDRKRFQTLMIEQGILQPKNMTAASIKEIKTVVSTLGYPVIIRPSNLLAGRAMAILSSEKDLDHYIEKNSSLLYDGAILVESFLKDAIEVDVDALSDGNDVVIAGIMQHIEKAGIHSGDSTSIMPPFSLQPIVLQKIEKITHKLAECLNIIGVMNIQYAVVEDEVYVIEVNPRASRSLPFVAKSTGVPIVKIAAKLMTGDSLSRFSLPSVLENKHYAVKEVVLPFTKFNTSDVLLSTEMKSTGEVMCFDENLYVAYYKAQLSASNPVPHSGNIIICMYPHEIDAIAETLQCLDRSGRYFFYTSEECSICFSKLGLKHVEIVSCSDKSVQNLLSDIPSHLLVNTLHDITQSNNSFMRYYAHSNGIAYATTLETAKFFFQAMVDIIQYQNISYKKIQEFSMQSFLG